MAKIISKPQVIETNEKRFYSGVVIEDNCPICGKLCTFDGRNDYLSYPKLNSEYELDMYCINEETDEEHEWKITIRLDLKVSIVKDNKNE